MSVSKPIFTVGKRKIAKARALIKSGTGKIRINSKPLELWGSRYLVYRIKEPLELVPELVNKVDIEVSVRSGGISAQADAVRTAIGRALAEFGGEKTKTKLLAYDRTLLVPDMRQNEQWRAGRSKPRASAQKSKR